MPNNSKRPVLWCKLSQCSGNVTVFKLNRWFILQIEHAIPDTEHSNHVVLLIIGCSYLFVFIQQGWPPPQPSSLQWLPNPRTAALPSPNRRKVSLTLAFLCIYFPPSSSAYYTLVSSGYLLCHTVVMWSRSVHLAGFVKTGGLSCCSSLI